jgi:hypothetical protein
MKGSSYGGSQLVRIGPHFPGKKIDFYGYGFGCLGKTAIYDGHLRRLATFIRSPLVLEIKPTLCYAFTFIYVSLGNCDCLAGEASVRLHEKVSSICPKRDACLQKQRFPEHVMMKGSYGGCIVRNWSE